MMRNFPMEVVGLFRKGAIYWMFLESQNKFVEGLWWSCVCTKFVV